MRAVKAAELQAVREAAGLTQVEFAERLGVHPVTLSRFERGRDPITTTVDLAIHELARRLSVDIETIIPPVKPRKLATKKKGK